MVNHEDTKGKFPWELGKRISQAAKVFTERKLLFKGYVTLFATNAVAIISIGNSMICSEIWHKYHE